jgi:hypothetical protein
VGALRRGRRGALARRRGGRWRGRRGRDRRWCRSSRGARRRRRSRLVTGFFDKDEDGAAAEGEKIFSLRRDVTSQDAAKYQISGHGAYASYHSPVWDIMMGMAMGSMISRMFMPGYMPMYTAGYTTSPARRGQLASQRSSYRAQNPGKFAKSSGSGRSYGAKGSSWGSKGSTPSSAPRRSGGFGGGRFGLRDRGARERIRLES